MLSRSLKVGMALSTSNASFYAPNAYLGYTEVLRHENLF
jgi:hypothetical protein